MDDAFNTKRARQIRNLAEKANPFTGGACSILPSDTKPKLANRARPQTLRLVGREMRIESAEYRYSDVPLSNRILR